MNSRKRPADVSVRELQLSMQNEATVCQSELTARKDTVEEPTTSKQETEQQDEETPTDSKEETSEVEAGATNEMNKSTASLPENNQLSTEKEQEEVTPAETQESHVDEKPPSAKGVEGSAAEGEKGKEGVAEKEDVKEGSAEKGDVKEGSAEKAAPTPFQIGGSVFSSFKLPSLPAQTPDGAERSPQSPPLGLIDGGGDDEKVGGRPKCFPGEEEEELTFSEMGVTLLKCVNVATDEKEPAKFKFKPLGNGIVRLLKGSSSSRLIFRQAGTWHLLLNSPRDLISKIEKTDTASSSLIKFIAFDFTKETESNKLSVYYLKFPDQKSRDELFAIFTAS